MSSLLKRLSIQNKLMLSMASCLLMFLFISATLSVTLTGNGIRERVVTQELPAEVGEIRNDVLRQIGAPLAASLAVANNTFLMDWEKQGTPEAGIDAWKAYAARLQAKMDASTVFWVSGTTGKYFGPDGLSRTLDKAAASDQWFYGFLASGKPYTLDLDKEPGATRYMLFINARFDAGDGKTGAAGVGLARSEEHT